MRLGLKALLLLVTSLAISAADDLKTATPSQTETNRTTATGTTRATKLPKTDKVVTYSGFFVDLSRTNKPGKLLNLRKPADPASDVQNLHFDTRSSRPNGVRLFSVDF